MTGEQRPHRVIFVCGSARSGSTLVDLVLGNDPRGFSLGEIASWFRPTRTHHFDLKCGCGVYPCPVWEPLMKVREAEFYPALFAQLDVDFVVDSSKRLPWVIDQNLRLRRHEGFAVDNLFLYKRPIALAHSHFKRGEDPIANVKRAFTYYEQALAARLPMATLDYDALVRDPGAVLPQVCAWLGIAMDPTKMEFWRKTHHHVFGSFGPRAQLLGGAPRSIYVETFTPEFEAVRADLERRLAADPWLSRVMGALEERDVLRLAERGRERPDCASIRRPRFYWEQKLRDLRARCWPKHHLDREASMIREWRV